MKKAYPSVVLILTLIWACQTTRQEDKGMTFGEELAFLERYVDVIVLSDSAAKSRLIVVPAWQGRVMTSTANGDQGLSFGWINHELISSGETQEHINVYGGEDRFWMGPEGGQFAIFFKNNDPFDLEHWQVPSIIDTEVYSVLEQARDRIVFGKDFHLVNYSNTELDGEILREVRLLSETEIADFLSITVPEDIASIGYTSVNTIINRGAQAWTKETGLLSIWILGMFTPSPETSVVIPFIEGDKEALGPIVNDAYFGRVPEDRMRIDEGFVYFKGDGQYRSKIGLSPLRSKPILGSYDGASRVLTIVTYSKPQGAVDYVNSMWEIQENPFGGDVVNSYNDGPPQPGAEPLGPFYELETSSPAAALNPGESLQHEHRTFHFQGTEASLDKISTKCLGVSLEKIKSALR